MASPAVRRGLDAVETEPPVFCGIWLAFAHQAWDAPVQRTSLQRPTVPLAGGVAAGDDVGITNAVGLVALGAGVSAVGVAGELGVDRGSGEEEDGGGLHGVWQGGSATSGKADNKQKRVTWLCDEICGSGRKTERRISWETGGLLYKHKLGSGPRERMAHTPGVITSYYGHSLTQTNSLGLLGLGRKTLLGLSIRLTRGASGWLLLRSGNGSVAGICSLVLRQSKNRIRTLRKREDRGPEISCWRTLPRMQAPARGSQAPSQHEVGVGWIAQASLADQSIGFGTHSPFPLQGIWQRRLGWVLTPNPLHSRDHAGITLAGPTEPRRQTSLTLALLAMGVATEYFRQI